MSKASEGIFDDSVVYVTRQGSQVGVDGGRITVYMKDEGEIASFPMGQVDTINIFGNINFTTPFVARANEHGIVLNYFTQNGRYRGSFVPERNTIAEVRRCQYALSEKENLKIAKEIIRGKIRNSRTLLNRKDVSDTGKLSALEAETARARDLDGLRGIEGEAAEIYFRLLNGCLADGWTFERRTRRPPEDHINSLLSLTYSMMKNEVLSALRQYNLDPFLGILHADRHGRPALALDLQEEFRPIFCDAFALRLINKAMLKHEDFKMDNHLKDYAFKIYLEKFDGSFDLA
jgi:CRISPR-associated protein Cas1